MTIIVHTTNEGEVTLILGKTFDFNCLKEFERAYERIHDKFINNNTNEQIITVDLQNTHYMDSSALGMLINMQKCLQDRCNSIRIINSKPHIKKIFSISRFDKKFDID